MFETVVKPTVEKVTGKKLTLRQEGVVQIVYGLSLMAVSGTMWYVAIKMRKKLR